MLKFFPFLLLFFLFSCTSAERLQFETVKRINLPNYYKKFLNDFPNSFYEEEVLHLLEYAELNEALTIGTEESYNKFIQENPSSPHLPIIIKAKEDFLIEKIFKEIKAEDTLQGYSNFVSKYPKHNLSKVAEKLIYQKHIREPNEKLIEESNNILIEEGQSQDNQNEVENQEFQSFSLPKLKTKQI